MKIMRQTGIFLALFFTAFAALASAEQLTLAKANKAYSEGSFSEAAGLYQKVAEAGYASPGLYYNLGNACFKMNDYARAILWYERAKRLDPGNEDIDYNLNVANTKISDKIEPLPALFYKRWFTTLVQLFPVDAWARMCVWLFIAGLAGLVLYIASGILFLRKVGFWCAIGLFFLSLTAFLFAWSGNRSAESTSEAIVFTPTITAKSSPDDGSTDLFVLHEGTKVRLLDNIGSWYEIRIANGSVGWLPKTSLEKI
jgi:tetratricopeptide (TPR) repeat protein